MPPVIDEERCTLCGTCYDRCPTDVFTPAGDEPPCVAYPEECWHCAACVIDCPAEAVVLDLPLQMHIVPSPALYGPPGPEEADALRQAAAFSRSIVEPS